MPVMHPVLELSSLRTRNLNLHFAFQNCQRKKDPCVCVFFFFNCFWQNVKLDPTGDLEKKFDLEISPMCNQQADSVPTIQTGECASRGVNLTAELPAGPPG